MKKYKLAAVLMIIHGGLMEVGGIVFAIFSKFLGSNINISQYFSFKLSYLQENTDLMLFMGAIFGIVRLVGAFGLLKNRMWGWVLSLINCIVTMILMIFMLPAGLIDGILACGALVFILQGYYGNREIIPRQNV